jgi:hypothetical protein
MSRQGAPTSTAQVPAQDRDALLTAWRRTLKTAAPKGISTKLLDRIVAYEQQVQAQGGITPSVRRRLARLAAGQPQSPRDRLRPGARLVRDWNGVSHIVEVTEAGFVWQNRSYRSLSAVARAITGARWSGPRFFGLLSAETAQ